MRPGYGWRYLKQREAQIKNFLLALAIVFSTAVGTAQGNDDIEANYSQLRRLHSALAVLSFPTPSQDGIQTWKQESESHGMVNKFDLTKFPLTGYEEFPLDSIVKF